MNTSQKFLHIFMLFAIVHTLWCYPLSGISGALSGLKNDALDFALRVEDIGDKKLGDLDGYTAETAVETVRCLLP